MTESPARFRIRRVAQDDEAWLLDCIRKFDAESDYKTALMPDDPELIREIIRSIAQNHLFLVAEEQYVGPVGFVCGTITPCPINPKLLMFNEILWWVDPVFRGRTAAGARLLDDAVDWAKGRGAQLIWWSLQRTTKVRKGSMENRGFVEREVKYLMEVQ